MADAQRGGEETARESVSVNAAIGDRQKRISASAKSVND